MKPQCHVTRGEVLHFATTSCSLGSVLVAASGKGVCALLLGDHPESLVAELQNRFSGAALAAGEGDFARLVAQAVHHVEAPATDWDLPLDLRGTAFQQRVWQQLREIPAGSTGSYARIAAEIGRPGAARAVAGACAANPVAIAVPCHRVVRGDGSLAGYRWGIDRKRTLLDRESKR